MKFRPINLDLLEIRAILNDNNNEIRRPLKHQPRVYIPIEGAGFKCLQWQGERHSKGEWKPFDPEYCYINDCPYSRRSDILTEGDGLWVKEAALPDFPKEFSYYEWTWAEVPEEYRCPKHVLYQESWGGSDLKWKPSITMPRWASRLLLAITDVQCAKADDDVWEWIIEVKRIEATPRPH